MEFVLLGWPSDGPALRLDYRRFSYAGKFVMTNTGKAVLRETTTDSEVTLRESATDSETVSRAVAAESESERGDDGGVDEGTIAAVAFSEDRTDPDTLWLRYVTVRADRRGEGLGPRLVRRVVARAEVRGYERLRIAVNNPFAYEALYRAGFAFTGETTGIAELILERPADRSTERYRDGFERFRSRELSEKEATFLRRKRNAEPPEVEASAAAEE